MTTETPTFNLPAVPAVGLPAVTPPAVRALDNMQRGIQLFDLPRITVPAGGGTMFDRGGEGAATLTGVILASIEARALWVSKQPQPGTRPVCSALAAGDGRVDPEAEKVPVGCGGRCAACAYNFFGSAEPFYAGKEVPTKPPPPRRGVGAKACRETRVLYLLFDDDRLPTVLRVPPTSLPSYQKTVYALLQRNDFAWHRRIVVGLEKATGAGGAYSRLTFRAGAALTDDEQAHVGPLAAYIQAAVFDAAARDADTIRDVAYAEADGTDAD